MFLDSIKIVGDCNNVKGKVFSFISKNKDITIENFDFAPLPDSMTAQGTVKCRDSNRFNHYIDRE
ncbi:hypothetical protein KUL150_27120 [Alteromonas sp. KUL150]|nr:hypothetical protein KUL150_27120 [Alteromonas sp. KUL150]